MKLPTPISIVVIHFVVSMLTFASASETGDALKTFARYEQGKPLAILIEARREVFRGTVDATVRAERERELLAFIASDAHPQAKAIAVEWLGCLGGTASVTGLTNAAKDPALAAPVAAALEHIQGKKTTGSAAIGKDAAEVVAFNAALDGQAAGPVVDDRIAAALRSPNDLLAGCALRRLRAGSGTSDLTKYLLGSLDQLPASRRIPLCEALAPRPDAVETLHVILTSRVKSGDPDARVAALKVLGRILRPTDLPWVLALLSDTSTPGLPAAAKAALSRATDPAIDPALIGIAGSDAAFRIAAIDTLAARNSVGSAARLWSLTSAQDSQVSAAAYRALGALLTQDALPTVLEKFVASKEAASTDELGTLLWNVVRRHPDPEAAANLLDQHASQAPAETKERLVRYADRIRPKPGQPKEGSPKANTPAQSSLELPGTDERAMLMPDGYQQVAYLDCGSRDSSSGNDGVIRRTAGEAYQFGNTANPLATMDFGNIVSYEITGLVAGAEYVIGFSAWDADLQNRRQAFSVNGTVIMGDFVPLAYHADKPTCARIHLPLSAGLTSGGKASVSMQSLAGPNAVISELWLLRRQADAPKRKRVLILTGDDFVGHHWRETGPGFAAILRADPRLEVTISESPYMLDSPVLPSYDAVFLHFKNYAERLPTRESLWKNLERYVRGGGGLVIAHFGCGAMQEWNGFVNVAGRVWDPKMRGHDRYGEFMVRILQSSHPATKGLANFKTRDELYTCLAGDTKIEVLADAVSKADQSVHPMAFVLTPGKGRVFHSPLGHDLGALESKGARSLYLQGTCWAAGL